jgi:Inositol polyphosphate kinase
MDVKIGAITYDIHASAEKIAREKAKFPSLDDVCFQLGGIKVCTRIFNYSFASFFSIHPLPSSVKLNHLTS